MLLAVLVSGINAAWGQSDKSEVYTSNVTLSTTGGTSASTAKVIVTGDTQYDAIKAGTGSVKGAVRITVPAGTKYLHLHAAAWNGETVNIGLAPNGNLNASYLALTSDTGVSGSGSTYTLKASAKATTDYYKVLTFTTALASNTNITFTAGANSSSGKRFVIWGVNAEAEAAYTITAQSNNNTYGTVSLDGSLITGSPAAGYRYADPAYTVTTGTASVVQNGNDFSVTPTSDCTVQINFEPIPTYTVTLGDNSDELTELSGGAGVTLPSRSDVSIYSFAGWSTTNVSEETTTAPTIIPAGPYHPTGNITLYPVYTKIVGAGSQNESASVTIADYASANSWNSGTAYQPLTMDANISVGGTITGNNFKYYSSDDSWRFYSGGSFTISASNSASLTSVTLTFAEGSLSYSGDAITTNKAFAVTGTSATISASATTKITAISVDYTIINSGTTYYWSNPSAVNVTGVTLDQTSKALNVGDEFDLTATVAPNNATNKEVNWTSSNDALATVVDGHVTALAAGTPTITVTTVDGSFTATCNLTISNVAVSGVTLDKDEATIYTGAVGNTVQLTATVAPANATNKAVTWTSSEESVARVSNTGLVTAVAVGTTTITVTTTDGGFTATCDITVDVDPGSAEKPYTCAEAIAAQVAAGGDVTDKYVKGIVTKISGSNYWISDDGVVNNTQFECYNGKQEDGTTSIDNTYLNVGDVVVAHGNITKYSTTYELASGNVVYSKTRPVVTITRNNNDYGTATLDVRTVTAVPTEGYRLANPKYTVTGSATIVDNGDNTFSLSNIWDDCTIQINFEAIPSHTLNYAVTPANAGTVTLGTSSVKEGATTSAEAAAEAGYKFVGWSITGTGASLSSTTTNPTTVTMGTTDATLTATFEAVTTYEINWSVNGSIVKTENVEEDADINFAAPMSGVPSGYVFKGWVVEANKINTPTDTDPSANYVTSATSTEDITYYAVLAVETASPYTAHLTGDEIASNFAATSMAYGDPEKTYTDTSDDMIWGARCSSNKDRHWIQLRNDATAYLKAVANGTITKLKVKISNATNESGGIDDITRHGDFSGNVNLDNAQATNTGTYGSASSSAIVDNFLTITPTKSSSTLYIHVDAAARVWSVDVTYNKVTASHYCTTVSDVPVKVGSAGYTTITTEYPVSFDGSGVTAYKATAVNSTTIHLEEVEEAPAGTPLVIKATAGTYMIDIVNSASAVTGNLLLASDGSVTGDGSTIFALGVGKVDPYVGQVGFYLVKEKVAVPAGKAYLEVAAPGPGVKGFTFNFDIVTGVNAIAKSQEPRVNGQIFNLAGQKMSKLQKGVNIVNGKKVLVK